MQPRFLPVGCGFLPRCGMLIGSAARVGQLGFRVLLGRLIVDSSLEPGTVRPPDDNSSKAYFYLRFIVRVSEVSSDPYDLT